jgi:hypothetical protein
MNGDSYRLAASRKRQKRQSGIDITLLAEERDMT